MALSPKGYEYGISPKGSHPFWDQTGEITGVDATVDVGTGTGTPTASVDSEYEEGVVTLEFHFDGLKGEPGPKGEDGDPGPQGPQGLPGENGQDGLNGADGVTPDITANATVDATTGTPSVQVTKTGTAAEPAFTFAFSGLKGEQGPQGIKGDTGSQGPQGTPGTAPNITVNATADDTHSSMPSVLVTKTGTDAAPIFNMAFSGLKGEPGQTGQTGGPGPAGSDGVTPVISASASADSNTGTPSVQVSKTGSDAAPHFEFAFSNIKGETGPQGPQGNPGTPGTDGQSVNFQTGSSTYTLQKIQVNDNDYRTQWYFHRETAGISSLIQPKTAEWSSSTPNGSVPVKTGSSTIQMKQPRLYEKGWQSQGQVTPSSFYTLWNNSRVQKMNVQYALSGFVEITSFGTQTVDYYTVENDGTLALHQDSFSSASDTSGAYWNIPLSIDKNFNQGDPHYSFNRAMTGGAGFPTITVNGMEFTYDIISIEDVVDTVNQTAMFKGNIILHNCVTPGIIFKASKMPLLTANLVPTNYVDYLQTVV